MSITNSMISICILAGLALQVSGTPQSRGMGLSFPGEYDAGTDYYGGDYGTDDGTNYEGGIEEFYDSPDKKIYLPGNPGDNFSYDNYDDDDSEPSTFVSEEDLFELPDWMNLDFNELPLDKLELLNNASDLNDLAAFLDLDQENADKLSELQTNGTQTESRSATGVVMMNYENPVFARCEPERVKVVLEVAKNTRYLPSCVRLMRCGGCCNNEELLSCQPTKSEVISLKVIKISSGITRSNRGKRSTRGRRRGRRTSGSVVTIPEENHSECSCQCKVQERHCDPAVHEYNKDVCACLCKDEVKKTACLKNSGLQTWNSKSCTCMCRTVKQCGNGELFSQDTCGCIPAPRF